MESARQGYTAIGGDFEKAFRYERILKLVNVNDDIATVLRLHLVIENILELWVSKATQHPEILAHGRFSFAHKLALAEGSGLPQDLAKAYGHINKVRNQIAHAKTEELSDAQVESMAALTDNIVTGIKENDDLKVRKLHLGIGGILPSGEAATQQLEYATSSNRIKLIIAGCILLTKSVALFTSELSSMGVPLTVGEAMPSDFEPPSFE
ncbi:hypothetical protein HaloA020_11270 [Halomonas sp. A020]|uniref:hypothetical protein n=1 Tax=Halomonas sp. A020 TaxID=2717374 RepID=UPI002492C58B|nr:hypothetical protein [Halomonas sp. A020]BCB60426.1 hypothetical protein HaloA020_11270 [Halomonas sp. A020]